MKDYEAGRVFFKVWVGPWRLRLFQLSTLGENLKRTISFSIEYSICWREGNDWLPTPTGLLRHWKHLADASLR